MLFTYATARSLVSASVVTKGLSMDIPVIAYNGAFIFEPSSGDIQMPYMLCYTVQKEIRRCHVMNPYEKCPVYENETYLLKLVDIADAPDLLLVYSDEKSVPFFNSDNCGGDDFYYTSLERMRSAIEYWLWEYERKGFVRWSIYDKNMRHAIGTIELFNRRSGSRV